MKKKIILGIAAVVVLLFGGAACLFLACTGKQNDAQAVLEAYTKDNPEAAITVGVWENGKEEFHVYGENGKELPAKVHTYAIGSLTKTFDGSLIAKAVSEGKIKLEDPIGNYVNLNGGKNNPTFKSLVTHTSGLTDQWEDTLTKDENAVFTREKMLSLLAEQEIPEGEHDSYYSNFGTALAGTAVAESYGGSYDDVMNAFIKDDLKLPHTQVGGTGDLKNYWDWKNQGEMKAAGAVVSDINDMLLYGREHLENTPSYLELTHQPQTRFDETYDCGYFWMVDKENNIYFHNGEVEIENEKGEPVGFQSFLGIAPNQKKVVVVLANVIARDEEDTDLADLLGYLQLMSPENALF